ncbi:MAG: hypothetical protein JXA25_10470 [Anaerolineales bacterium]|nr:hypothetical protein [Anaerolineales bacterium]
MIQLYHSRSFNYIYSSPASPGMAGAKGIALKQTGAIRNVAVLFVCAPIPAPEVFHDSVVFILYR